MAKKAKSAIKKKKKTKAAHQQSRKEIERVLSGPLRRPPARLKQETLPGVPVRSATLDRICASLYDVRMQLSDLKGQDAGLVAQAVRTMQSEQIRLHRAHHIELTLKAGDVRVFARLIKADGSAEELPETDIDNDAREADSTAEPSDVPV